MRKGLLTIILICTVLIAFSINVFSVNEEANEIANSEALNEQTNMTLEEQYQDIGNKIEDSNNRLEYVESELTATLQKVQELNASIEQYQAEYNDLNNQIAGLENEIATTDLELEEIETKYQKKQNLLKKRTVALYEAGDTTYLDVLLSSGNLIDFISNYYLLEQIIEYDTDYEDYKQLKEVESKYLAKAKILSPYFNVSILLDYDFLLPYKSSPIDEGKDIFEEILQHRRIV